MDLRLLTLTVAGVLAIPVFSFAADKCATAEDQATLSQCADASFKKSDKRLNDLYKQIEGRLSDDVDTKKLLVQAQRGWGKFRDAECNFQTSGAAGGSMAPMLVLMCRDTLTKFRIKDFEGYLKCQEGDMSCPVPAAD
jgi:uncharacterized protein YecT (DUF1311 family)